MNLKKPSLLRRSISGAALLVLAACSNVAQAATYTMFRDPGCGCCLNWAGHVEDGMNTKVASVDSNDMAAIKTARGVPQELWSCHTMEVDGYIIEGHVPAEAAQIRMQGSRHTCPRWAHETANYARHQQPPAPEP